MIDGEKFSALVGSLVEGYDSWDLMPGLGFLSETPDGGLSVDVINAIGGNLLIDTSRDDVMMILAANHLGRCQNHESLAGAFLTFEAWGVVEPGPDAPVADRARYTRDRVERRFSERPDRKETAMALCVDVWGRAYGVATVRGEPGVTLVPASGPMFGRLRRVAKLLATARDLARASRE